MTYDLVIGDYAYSSWSLRGWLLFEKFGISAQVTLVDFSTGVPLSEQMPDFAPAKTVPTVRTPEGVIVSESLAIAEELASRHPDAGLWPSDPGARAMARNLVSEMHAGFMDLRNECPMNLRTAYSDSSPSEAVLKDVARLETIWKLARDTYGADGEWLCGEYSAADAFYAPVAARLAGYNLPMSDMARSYVSAHLRDPAFRKWRALGLEQGETLPWYAKDYPVTDWPES